MMASAHRVLVIALAAGLALLSGAGIAAARPVAIPTPEDAARNLARMLTVQDVPRSLVVDSGWEYTIKAHGGQHQSLCDKNGEDVQGRETDLLYQVELGETNLLEDPTAIEQKVWPYASTGQALREWQYLQREVRKCTGRSTWRTETGGLNVQILSWGYTNEAVRGNRGIWIYIDSRSAGFNPDTEDGGYYVLFPVGSTIQSVEYDFPDAVGLSLRTRTQVQQLAVTVAQRWLDEE